MELVLASLSHSSALWGHKNQMVSHRNFQPDPKLNLVFRGLLSDSQSSLLKHCGSDEPLQFLLSGHRAVSVLL